LPQNHRQPWQPFRLDVVSPPTHWRESEHQGNYPKAHVAGKKAVSWFAIFARTHQYQNNSILHSKYKGYSLLLYKSRGDTPMCLAIPARVVEILPGQRAVVDLGGVRKEVSIDLVADAQVDDYVIIHVGYAIGKIDPEEALRTLALFAELSEAQNSPKPSQNMVSLL